VAGLVLASKSPRRAVLLRLLTDDFVVEAVQVTEEAPRALPVPDALEVIARKKAMAAARLHPGAFVLAADTVVVYRGRLVGKARSELELRANLAMLAGETHEVHTGLALARNGESIDQAHAATKVTFDRLPADVLGRYVASEAWYGKAGGYGIQDALLAPYLHVDGAWSTVVGLPLAETAAMLGRNGVAVRDPPGEDWLRDHNPFDATPK